MRVDQLVLTLDILVAATWITRRTTAAGETGVILMARQHLDWTEAWLLIGIGAVVAAGAVGGASLIPEGRRLAELVRTPGHDSAEIAAALAGGSLWRGSTSSFSSSA